MRKKLRTAGRTSRRWFEALETRCLLSADACTVPHLDPAFQASAGSEPVEPFDGGIYPPGATYSLSEVAAWHSKPAAAAKLFLDFDGAPAQDWDGYDVPATPAYDQDGIPTSFTW